MNTYRNQIATYYNNAKLLVKQGNAKDARLYVLAFVNIAYEIFKQQKGLMERAKTQAFLVKWVRIAQILREKGIDDYVRECFGFVVTNPDISKKMPPPSSTSPEDSVKKSGTKTPKINIDDFLTPTKKYGSQPESNEHTPEVPPDNNDYPKISTDEFFSEDYESQGWAADVFEKRSPSIVTLTCNGVTQSSTGTGFIISSKGYLITNDHVVYNDSECGFFNKIVMRFSGDKKAYKVHVITSNKTWDVALCQFEPNAIPDIKPVKFINDYSRLKQGADILVIGNGFSMGLAPFTGTVKFTHNDIGNLVYTAPSNPGDSGGPVFNRYGECVGINKSVTVSIIRGSEKIAANGLTNATPADKICELIEKWTRSIGIEL